MGDGVREATGTIVMGERPVMADIRAMPNPLAGHGFIRYGRSPVSSEVGRDLIRPELNFHPHS